MTSDSAAVRALRGAYAAVDRVDPYIGALAEDPVDGGNLGELITASTRDQFHRLRAGDRFWFENGQFDDDELEEIRGTRFADVIRRNTNISYRYSTAFFVPSSQLDGGLFADPLVRSPALETEFENVRQLDETFVLYWTVDRASARVRFAAVARTQGWLGIGFSKSNERWAKHSKMYHVDMAIGRVTNKGPGVEDYFSFELGAPSRDVDLGCADDFTDASLEVKPIFFLTPSSHVPCPPSPQDNLAPLPHSHPHMPCPP